MSKGYDWKALLWKFKWLGLAFVIALPTAIIGNHFYHKKDVKDWNEDVKISKGPGAWGATSFRITYGQFSNKQTDWIGFYNQGISSWNKELSNKFGLKPRICIKGLDCKKIELGAYPADVTIKAAPKSWAKFLGITKVNLCEPVYKGDGTKGRKDVHGMAKLVPHARNKDGNVTKFTIYTCAKKWNDMLHLKDTPVVQYFTDIGKKTIAKHELGHLFFHKHVLVEGGIMNANPGSNYELDKNGAQVFRDKILIGYALAGLIKAK